MDFVFKTFYSLSTCIQIVNDHLSLFLLMDNIESSRAIHHEVLCQERIHFRWNLFWKWMRIFRNFIILGSRLSLKICALITIYIIDERFKEIIVLKDLHFIIVDQIFNLVCLFLIKIEKLNVIVFDLTVKSITRLNFLNFSKGICGSKFGLFNFFEICLNNFRSFLIF